MRSPRRRPIELTATEFRLLRYLMLNPRRVLTRAQLLDHVWSYDFGGDARVLETYISYLRKKIDADGPPLLHTVRGVGYRSLPRAIPRGLSRVAARRLLAGIVVLVRSGLTVAAVVDIRGAAVVPLDQGRSGGQPVAGPRGR